MLTRLFREILGRIFRSNVRSASTDEAELTRCFSDGNLGQAQSLCDSILQIDSKNPTALLIAGIISHRRGDAASAVNLLTRATQVSTDPQIELNLARVLRDLGRDDDALRHYLRALGADPGLFEAHLAAGIIFFRKSDFARAESHFRAAVSIRPESAEAENWLTYLLDIELRFEELIAHQRRMQRLLPNDGRSIMLALLVPRHYHSVEQIRDTRARLTREIRDLLDGPPLHVADPAQDIGVATFSLAYHGENDRELQQLAAQLCRKAYQPKHSAPLERRRRGKIRIGFFSEHFNNHPIGRLNLGLITHLSRRDFELCVFSFARHQDAIAQRIRAAADRYIAFENEPLATIEAVVAKQELDVLFYPDIGMDPLAYFLAYSRLAPVQCVTWGHPVTTGIDTIDYFISADAIEPSDAADHYSEQLVRLPAFFLPAYEKPPLLTAVKSREQFGLRDDRHLYICPQSLFKLHPDFDWAIGEILRRDPKGEVLLIHDAYPMPAATLRERWRRNFPDVEERVKFMPRMPWLDCLNLMAVSDVMLDTFHFGGGNTTYEGLAMGTPIVTLPASYLRGRFTLGCYLEMGLNECVARTPQHYVDLAVHLAQERDYREHVSRKIVATRDVLFENVGAVRALDDFLLRVCPAGK